MIYTLVVVQLLFAVDKIRIIKKELKIVPEIDFYRPQNALFKGRSWHEWRERTLNHFEAQQFWFNFGPSMRPAIHHISSSLPARSRYPSTSIFSGSGSCSWISPSLRYVTALQYFSIFSVFKCRIWFNFLQCSPLSFLNHNHFTQNQVYSLPE